MEALGVIVAIIAVVLLAGGLHRSARKRRREEVRSTSLAEEEKALLIEKVPLYARMPGDLQVKLDGLIQVFLMEVGFESCGQLREITREMQLLVASQSCLLLMASGYEHFGRLRSVLIYPNAYEVRDGLGVESVRCKSPVALCASKDAEECSMHALSHAS